MSGRGTLYEDNIDLKKIQFKIQNKVKLKVALHALIVGQLVKGQKNYKQM